jgi:hypothetical protein
MVRFSGPRERDIRLAPSKTLGGVGERIKLHRNNNKCLTKRSALPHRSVPVSMHRICPHANTAPDGALCLRQAPAPAPGFPDR